MKAALVLAMAMAVVVAAAPWDDNNDPSVFGAAIFNLQKLPTSGQTQAKPWSDTYWPSFQGGISARWQSDSPQAFKYSLNTKEQLQKMDPWNDIAYLSPAEKWDIYQARYDYPTVNSEWQRCSPQDPEWEGLCHGWSPAALQYTEPNNTTVTNKDGITIPFGSSDVKALLIYWAGEYGQSGETSFVGSRCNVDLEAKPDQANTTACADINAGSLLVVLANQIGTLNQGLVIDRDRSIQVWNQPTYTFTAQIGAASGNNTYAVTTSLSYAKETAPAWNAHEPYIMTETFQHNVEVDGQGNVVGGSFAQGQWDRPDFMWKLQITAFSDYFAPLQQLYEQAIHSSNSNAFVVDRAANLPPHRSPAQWTNRVVLTQPSHSFGLISYSRNEKRAWVIRPSNDHDAVRITFKRFDTDRFRDFVRVYEGVNCDGALVRVLHGASLPEPVVVKSQGACVTFVSHFHSSETGMGFEAEYEGVKL